MPNAHRGGGWRGCTLSQTRVSGWVLVPWVVRGSDVAPPWSGSQRLCGQGLFLGLSYCQEGGVSTVRVMLPQ